MFLGKFVVLQTLVLERVESVECIKTERLFFYLATTWSVTEKTQE